MQKVNDTSTEGDNQAILETPENPDTSIPAQSASPEPVGEPIEAKGLSRRDALEVAIQATKEDKPAGRDKGLDVQYKGKPAPQAQKPAEPARPALQPPAEYTREEKEDFLASTPKQQEAALRLHRSRMSTLEEIRRQSSEFGTYRKLAEDVEPFIKAMGIKDPSPVAIQKALKMWRDFETAEDPRLAAAEYLKAKGREDAIPEGWADGDQSSAEDKVNASLQKELDQIKLRLAREDHQKALQPVVEALRDFESVKNAAGKPKYPSFRSDDTSEAGLEFARSFGSLVNGATDFSKEFIARTKARIPDLTVQKLYEEAYKFAGGKVDETEAPRNQEDTQKHLVKSNRAASSVPGTGSNSSSGQVKKYKTYREAAAAALAALRESEGN